MRSTSASIWYVPAIGDNNLAFLVKAPSSALKAMIEGCPFQLFFGKENEILCIGIKIVDIPDSPLFISTAQVVAEEQSALFKCILEGKFPIFLFNEMDACVAWSEAELEANDCAELHKFIGEQAKLYNGQINDDVLHILDCFEYTVDKERTYHNAHDISTFEIVPKATNWTSNKLYYYGEQNFQKIMINDFKEGKNFENTIWSSLTSVFPSTLFKSPKVKKGNNIRELTDIFAYWEQGVFIIEAKDLSVSQAGYQLKQSKRISNLQKQVEKAIKQLIGAAKAFSRGDTIYDSNGKEISVSREIPPHCIILITEFINSKDWDTLQHQMDDAMKKTGALFHLLDLRELIIILKQSSGKPDLFDLNLIERCKVCYENKLIFVRGK